MGFRILRSAGFPDRSSRPRPAAFPSFLTFLTCAGCVYPHFSLPSGGNEGGGGGSSEDASSVKALLEKSKDALQSPSSPDSSHSMDPSSALGADRSNAPTENYVPINPYHRILHVDNLQSPSSRYSSSSMGMVSSPSNNSSVRGLLGFINTIAEKMILFFFGLATFSWGYPLGQKAEQSFKNPSVQFICTGSVIFAFGSCIMAGFASHFKESESVDHVTFEIFIWLLFLELVVFITEFCVTLHVFARVSNWVVWPLGITGFCFMALTWVVYLERPKFLNKWTTDVWMKIGMLPEDPSVPRPQT